MMLLRWPRRMSAFRWEAPGADVAAPRPPTSSSSPTICVGRRMPSPWRVASQQIIRQNLTIAFAMMGLLLLSTTVCKTAVAVGSLVSRRKHGGSHSERFALAGVSRASRPTFRAADVTPE